MICEIFEGSSPRKFLIYTQFIYIQLMQIINLSVKLYRLQAQLKQKQDMKFAQLLKHHSNSKTVQYGKPITVNCNRNNMNIKSNFHEQSSDSYQDSDYAQQNHAFVAFPIRHVKHRLNNQLDSKQLSLHQIFDLYQQDQLTQWVIQVTQTGNVNLRKFKPSKSAHKAKADANRKSQLKSNTENNTNQLIQNQHELTYPSNQDKFSQYQQNLCKQKKRMNYSPMKRPTKSKVNKNKVIQYQNQHFKQNNFPKQNGLNLNKYSFGDQPQQQSYLLNSKNQNIKQKNKEAYDEYGTNLIQKFKNCQQYIIYQMKDQQHLQQSIQFNLQQNVQFSFQQINAEINKNIQEQLIQHKPETVNKVQPILNILVQNQIKQIDQYVLNEEKIPDQKYQIRIVESQFHISNSKQQLQQSFRLLQQGNAVQSIREQTRFIVKKLNCQKNQNTQKNKQNKLQSQVSQNCLNNRQNIFFTKAQPINQRVAQNKQDNNNNSNKIYCRANVKILTPEKIKYHIINQRLNQKDSTINQLKNKTEKVISLNADKIQRGDFASKLMVKKQNQQQLNNKVQNENSPKIDFSPKKDKNSQLKIVSNKTLSFLQNKKSPSKITQNDRVVKIVLHTPNIQKQTKNIFIKDNQQSKDKELNILSKLPQILMNIDRPQTPTPQTKCQQYNGGVSPKSKPKIEGVTNFNFHQLQQNNTISPNACYPQSKQLQNIIKPLSPAKNDAANNSNSQFLATTQIVNHYSSSRNMSPPPLPNVPNGSKMIQNYSNYVPYNNNPCQTQNKLYSNVSVSPLSQQNNNTNIQNTNLNKDFASVPFTTTYSPKPYVPYYNNLKQNQKCPTSETVNKPKIYNQLANLQRQNQTAQTKMLPLHQGNLSTNANITYKQNTNYQYNPIINQAQNVEFKKAEQIIVSPLGEYVKTKTKQTQIQPSVDANSHFITNNQNIPNYQHTMHTGYQNQSNYPITNGIPNKNNYLKVDYIYGGKQAIKINNNQLVNNTTYAAQINMVPICSPNNFQTNFYLIQGAKHAQSKVYEIKQGSSNSDINFSVQSYN